MKHDWTGGTKECWRGIVVSIYAIVLLHSFRLPNEHFSENVLYVLHLDVSIRDMISHSQYMVKIEQEHLLQNAKLEHFSIDITY